MSTKEEAIPSKRRGRPKKSPEDKIQDLQAYHKTRYENIKNNDEYKEARRQVSVLRNLKEK